MNKIIVAVVLCFLCLGVVEHQYLSATKKVALLTRQIDTIKIQSAVERQVLLNANDSLQKEVRFLALCVQYLDSVDRSKQTKSERAEKRGRFIGGIIKGIFPGL
jgi:hypothetical protein